MWSEYRLSNRIFPPFTISEFQHDGTVKSLLWVKLLFLFFTELLQVFDFIFEPLFFIFCLCLFTHQSYKESWLFPRRFLFTSYPRMISFGISFAWWGALSPVVLSFGSICPHWEEKSYPKLRAQPLYSTLLTSLMWTILPIHV